jgi:hypothetical protein
VISGRNGDPTQWITITGPESGAAAVIQADLGPCCNTVEITNSSYVALRNLTIDGRNVDGAFGVSAKGGTGNLVHHITIEGCTFLRHDTGQQNVAISTKTPTWGWVIRGNRVVGAGTGLYLGNSDGSCPFVGGLIERNLVQDTIGYNMQIKWQQPRPTVAGMPTTPTTTIIRHNVFIKTDRASPDGDRPNVLVGGFPDTGPGADDRYEIYGNFFFHNPRETLLQASGRVTIHDNIFVDVVGTAILLQNHDLPLKLAHVYNNTIYAAGTGINFGSAASQGDAVVGNLVFAATPTAGSITSSSGNLVDVVANAGSYVTAPSLLLGQMDFFPLAGQCQGAALDLSPFVADADYDRDFNATSKGGLTFRGAYAGEGANPGWHLDADVKIVDGTPPSDGGVGQDGGGTSDGGGADGGGTSDGGGPTGDAGGHPDAAADGTGGGGDGAGGGCGCRFATACPCSVVAALVLLAVVASGRRRRASRLHGSRARR